MLGEGAGISTIRWTGGTRKDQPDFVPAFLAHLCLLRQNLRGWRSELGFLGPFPAMPYLLRTQELV